VDEIVLAVDERADPRTVPVAAEFVDMLFVVPPATHMERYLGWLHGQCSGDWILRVDDDELPSEALTVALPDLIAEDEPTHYWLPRRWPHPTASQYIDEGSWGHDIQVRLVRALPGIWRFSGRLHTNIEVLGASRVLDTPLLHVVTLLHTFEARKAKAAAYDALVAGLEDDRGRPLNEVFVPEVVPELRRGEMPPVDRRRITAFLDQAGTEPPLAATGAHPAVARPSQQELDRWLGDRPVSPGAYRAAVRVIDRVPSMPAGEVRHVRVEVTNLGDDWWPRGPDPEPQILVGHRWRRSDGTEVEAPTPRTALTETVAPGATTRLTVAIQTPEEAGAFALVVDLVHEWVRWFDCPDECSVSVTAPYHSRYFAEIAAGSRRSAAVVLRTLMDLVPAASIADVGCGTGAWLNVARDLGVEDVRGVDGPWLRPEDAEVPAELVSSADLTDPFDFGRRFDLALSLEVGEHLPPSGARPLVATLVGAAPIVAFSAAIPGQGGTAHVNEQWPSYWAELFAEHGYEPVDCVRPVIWNDERIEWWYAQNLVLYGSPEALDELPALRDHPHRGATPLALVHPRSRA
jgi:hypothetical protein